MYEKEAEFQFILLQDFHTKNKLLEKKEVIDFLKIWLVTI